MDALWSRSMDEMEGVQHLSYRLLHVYNVVCVPRG